LKKGILSGKSHSEIAAILDRNGFNGVLARKITYWLYRRRIMDFMEAENISMELRKFLSENYSSGFYEASNSYHSEDLSRKYIFNTSTGYPVESVFMPGEKRNTICISSQAGCRMSCTFCNTGKMGFHGNLEAYEILNQVGAIANKEKITHMVFMGMGEPLDNYQNLMKSLDILTAEWGFAISPRNITVSTIGVKPYLEYFLKDTRCNLALSIHSAFDDERDGFIPPAVKYSIGELKDITGSYQWEKNRRVTFQYIMIKGINDTERHLSGLVKLVKGTPVRINLMSCHPPEGSMICSSSYDVMMHFKHRLITNGISASIRKSRGQDIAAACGLLGEMR
jgi:23S rRNA (adenine2503-C2)-methyltransferase